jgi:hypothetical protein
MAITDLTKNRQISDDVTLDLNCDKAEITSIVKEAMSHLGNRFSFSNLIMDFTSIANEKGLFDKKANVEYQGGIKLSNKDVETINVIVWELIWNRELVIALYANPNGGVSIGNFEFIKVRYEQS